MRSGPLASAIAIVIWIGSFVSFVIAVVRFWVWKCPRCDRRFIGIYDGFSFVRQKCFYCGLAIGSDEL
jgi:hypothetical protein